MKNKKKYVQIGTGWRARMFYNALLTTYKDTSELLAFCDINQKRMDCTNKEIIDLFGVKPLPTYTADRFEEMILEHKPDVVIVTTIDRTHHKYIVKAMELGCDVITEKPMTIDAEKCQCIINAINKTGKKLRVAFNYRYSPQNTKIRELVMNDVVGNVTSLHFEWLLNIKHGADYFRRWHRDKRNSGGLLVHKSTHHFDLVNFWIGSSPKTVFAMGDLKFYGRENAENRGQTKFYYRSHGSKNAKNDPFSLSLEENDRFKAFYLEAEKEDGYLRDQSVFGHGISIEDTMSVIVKYKNDAIMTYSLNAYMPWEGYRVCINGDKGRIEYEVRETSYVNEDGSFGEDGAIKNKSITVFPMFGKPYNVDMNIDIGGHGGGDVVLLEDIFGNPEGDIYNRAATYIDGTNSILTGIAANKSIATGMPIDVDSLVDL